MNQNGNCLKFVDELKKDKEIVLAAIKQNGKSLFFIFVKVTVGSGVLIKDDKYLRFCIGVHVNHRKFKSDDSFISNSPGLRNDYTSISSLEGYELFLKTKPDWENYRKNEKKAMELFETKMEEIKQQGKKKMDFYKMKLKN